MAGELTPSPMLSDALVILGAAGIVIPVFARFRVTPVIGFILIGVAVGPFGLGSLVEAAPWLRHITITDPEVLTPFADFGIVLLLFAIGLELSFNRLWQLRRLVFGLGALELLTLSSLRAFDPSNLLSLRTLRALRPLLLLRTGNLTVDCTDEVHPDVAHHAIMAARRRISSSVPARIPSRTLREASLTRSAWASVQAGLSLTTSAAGSALGRRGKCSPL